MDEKLDNRASVPTLSALVRAVPVAVLPILATPPHTHAPSRLLCSQHRRISSSYTERDQNLKSTTEGLATVTPVICTRPDNAARHLCKTHLGPLLEKLLGKTATTLLLSSAPRAGCPVVLSHTCTCGTRHPLLSPSPARRPAAPHPAP